MELDDPVDTQNFQVAKASLSPENHHHMKPLPDPPAQIDSTGPVDVSHSRANIPHQVVDASKPPAPGHRGIPPSFKPLALEMSVAPLDTNIVAQVTNLGESLSDEPVQASAAPYHTAQQNSKATSQMNQEESITVGDDHQPIAKRRRSLEDVGNKEDQLVVSISDSIVQGLGTHRLAAE